MRFLSLALLSACSSIGIGDIPAHPDDAGVTPSTEVSTFAVDTLLLGEGPDVWKRFGYDLDGVASNDCTPRQQASVEGDDGIDNAFGSQFVPFIQVASSDPSPSLTLEQFIHSGASTLVLRVVGTTNDELQTATGLALDVATGGSIAAPSFDTTMGWPTISSTNAHFSETYATSGVVVARSPDATLSVALLVEGAVLVARIHSAVVTFRRVSTALVDGVIAGTLDTSELVDALQALAGRISLSLCGSTFDGVASQIREMQDILLDGTNAPGVPCNAISIGLKFTAKQIANDTTTVDVPSPPDPCAADAGTD